MPVCSRIKFSASLSPPSCQRHCRWLGLHEEKRGKKKIGRHVWLDGCRRGMVAVVVLMSLELTMGVVEEAGKEEKEEEESRAMASG